MNCGSAVMPEESAVMPEESAVMPEDVKVVGVEEWSAARPPRGYLQERAWSCSARGWRAAVPARPLLVREALESEERYGAEPEPTEAGHGAAARQDGTTGASEGRPAADSDMSDRGPGGGGVGEEHADSETHAPVPDPFDDADALEDLGDEIATLAAHIHAATQRLLALIAEFERRRGWELDGHRSCAHWLAFRTGIDLGAAREKVRTARALVELPETSRAMSRGELSFSQVRALSRVARPDNETELLALAKGCTTAQLERLVRGWKRGSREDEAAFERQRHASRTLSVFPDLDGMYVVRGRLTPEMGVLLQRAIEAASDALYREPKERVLEREEERRRAAAQRRADALGLLAARAMAAGLGGRCGVEEAQARDAAEGAAAGAEVEGSKQAEKNEAASAEVEKPAEVAESRASEEISEPAAAGSDGPADAALAPTHLHALPCTCDVPISGTRAERYQVVLHVDEQTLRSEVEELTASRSCSHGRASPSEADAGRGRSEADAGCEPEPGLDPEPGRSDLEDGTRVSAETSRRLSCDAGLVRITHAADGSILDVGRRTRTISPALRRALEARDRGCRFPGCGLRFTDAHHVRHWADGGETSLSNTLLVCHHHHGLVHEGGWRVDWWGAGRAVFFDPRGGAHFDGRWEPPELPALPVRALVEQNRAAGAAPDPTTAGARWKREADIPDEIYFRALEALG